MNSILDINVMKNLSLWSRRILTSLPLIGIFYYYQITDKEWQHQLMILFVLIWSQVVFISGILP